MANNPQGLERFATATADKLPADPMSETRPPYRKSAPPRYRKTIIAGCCLGIGLLLALWHWLPARRGASNPDQNLSAGGSKTFRVEAAPARRQLSVRGIVGAGRAVPVLMPFDGVVREMKVQFGDRINSGDILLVLDSEETEMRLREARSGVLKAAMALDSLDHWETGPEVMRAKRNLEGAQASLAKLERQVGETKSLLDRGIVSRNEYDTLIQQRDSQKLTVAGAEQDLNVALKRGNSEGHQVAELELENARAKLLDLQQQFDGATVRAPVSGIALRPPLPTPTAPGSSLIEAGVHVQRGQTALMIADLSKLIVSGKVDEVDIDHIRIGQAVSITSDAFPDLTLSGRIVSGSAEADQDQSGREPTFNVRAAISQLSDDARNAIRIGMSARMTINLDEQPTAIVIPINAVERNVDGVSVKLVDQQTGTIHEQPVALGATTPMGVEVKSGLRSGDVLQIP